jgi:hypothetical protein
MVIPPRWQDVKPFSCGLAAVDTVDYKTGFIDKTGKVVVEPIWDGAYAFEDGLCWVYKRSKHGLLMGVIDTTGKVVVPPEWKEVTIYHGYIFARRVSQSHQIPITGKDLNYHESFPAEAAWFDKTGKMIWHSTP